MLTIFLLAIFLGHLILRYEDMLQDDNEKGVRAYSANIKYEPTEEI